MSMSAGALEKEECIGTVALSAELPAPVEQKEPQFLFEAL